MDSTTKSITLKLVKKDRNSPILSIQNFIYRSLNTQTTVELDKMWTKYQSAESHTLLIKEHKLDYESFKMIAEKVLETYEPYEVFLQPNTYRDQARVKHDELKPLII
jgi:hypothetical protein